MIGIYPRADELHRVNLKEGFINFLTDKNYRMKLNFKFRACIGCFIDI